MPYARHFIYWISHLLKLLFSPKCKNATQMKITTEREKRWRAREKRVFFPPIFANSMLVITIRLSLWANAQRIIFYIHLCASICSVCTILVHLLCVFFYSTWFWRLLLLLRLKFSYIAHTHSYPDHHLKFLVTSLRQSALLPPRIIFSDEPKWKKNEPKITNGHTHINWSLACTQKRKRESEKQTKKEEKTKFKKLK